jgi:uncharacterized protein (DUF362 family)
LDLANKKYLVSISKIKNARYSQTPPYNPPEIYPELINNFSGSQLDRKNDVYGCIRNSFRQLNYDIQNYKTQNWNPLGWLIEQGNTVMLNPNMLAEKHLYNNDWDYIITHGSVMRAVIDYVYIALNGKGRIIIADGPQADSDIEKILELTGIKEIQYYYKQRFNFDIEFIDFRDSKLIDINGVTGEPIKLQGDPAGSTVMDISNLSMFSELDSVKLPYYGSHYDISVTQKHHTNGKHEYKICKTPLIADVFINLPKLKTHKKCGLTVNLKSLVGGINADKNYLPHYIIGSPENRGDQFDKKTIKTSTENLFVINIKKYLSKNIRVVQFFARKFKKIAYKIFGETSQTIRSGNWYGNDTVWRMCLDLNRILMYGNPDGTLDKMKKKKFLSVVDGIISMEGNGPNAGTRKTTGIIIVGDNAVSVDLTCARIMGFDENKIKIIKNAINNHEYPLFYGKFEDVNIVSNNDKWNAKRVLDIPKEDSLNFIPHFGWKGHIEL